jgi:drug/metabolite transporter (DMT)-like permease
VSASGTSAGLGLLSAATWGGSDFVGGLGSRRAPAMLVVASGHIVSLLILVGICVGAHLALPGRHHLLFAAVAGFEGSLALALFYRALAMGAMGLTAALTGLLTALVPVLFSFFTAGPPGPMTAIGLSGGLVAIWLITHTPSSEGPTTPPTALLLGALAGIGFGIQLILFKMASGGGLLWIMTSARAAGSLAMILVIAAKPPKRPWEGFWQLGVLAGVLDTLGNLFYLRATQLGRLDVAAVICSLYPAGTILLAGLVLRELPTKRQLAGMALALGAVMLLSA